MRRRLDPLQTATVARFSPKTSQYACIVVSSGSIGSPPAMLCLPFAPVSHVHTCLSRLQTGALSSQPVFRDVLGSRSVLGSGTTLSCPSHQPTAYPTTTSSHNDRKNHLRWRIGGRVKTAREKPRSYVAVSAMTARLAHVLVGLLVLGCRGGNGSSLRFHGVQADDVQAESYTSGRKLLGKEHKHAEGELIPLYANKVGPFQNPR